MPDINPELFAAIYGISMVGFVGVISTPLVLGGIFLVFFIRLGLLGRPIDIREEWRAFVCARSKPLNWFTVNEVLLPVAVFQVLFVASNLWIMHVCGDAAGGCDRREVETGIFDQFRRGGAIYRFYWNE